MCGICGYVTRDPRQPALDQVQLQAMTDVIRHRGPDEEGHLRHPGIALGMRRLSIIDLVGSHQPLSNEDGTVWTVFNGEIFNYREIHHELEAAGHRLATTGDTETIVHLYEDHGPRFAQHLRGMFSIALWDDARRRLVLARDRMGVKPLYLLETADGLAFASEVKSLIAAGLLDPALDLEAAELFFAYGYVPGPRTLFAGVRKLPPAHVLVWEGGAVSREERYWDRFDSPRHRPNGNWHHDQAMLLELLGTATQQRMVSDVPLGVMLSGGLDSSLLSALMAQTSREPIRTFSIGFAEDGAANELADAREVAKRLGTDHHELVTSAADHPELLDEALWHLEEPIADLSYLGFLLLSRLARNHVTVALSGQGADELLGGYRKHQIAAAAGHVGRAPVALRRALRSLETRFPPGSTAQRGLAAIAAENGADRLLAMSRVVQAHERDNVLAPGFGVEDAERLIREAVVQHDPGRPLSSLAETLFLDSNLALVDNMLHYFDKMSMAASLEVRVPFMDHDLVAFCAGLGDSELVWWTRRKALLKRASRGLVDDRIIHKKKRGFFRSALGTWLRMHRDDLFTETLLDDRALARGQFREATVRRLLSLAGEESTKAHQVVFAMFLLEKWQRFYVDADGPGRTRTAGLVDALGRPRAG